MSERAPLVRSSAGAAHPGSVSRVLPGAGGGLLGIHLSGTARGRTRHRLPEPGAGTDASVVVAPPARTPSRVAAGAETRDYRSSAMTDSAAAQALRTGDVALVVVPAPVAGSSIATTTTRPESRTARLLVDDALQRAAGRHDPVPVARTAGRRSEGPATSTSWFPACWA